MVTKIFFSLALLYCSLCSAQSVSINDNKQKQQITVSNKKISFLLTYDHQCQVTGMEVNGQKVIDSVQGIYSAIQVAGGTFSTLHLDASPTVRVSGNSIDVIGITYGNNRSLIHESWKFIIEDTAIKFTISRNMPAAFEAEAVSFPAIEFNNIDTWEGAFQGFGGIAWFYLFNEKLCTYGVHTDEASFWNSKTNNGLNVNIDAAGKKVAMKYTRTDDDKLACGISISQKELIPRYDSGTHRRRFIRKKTDVWAPFVIEAGNTSQTITFSYFDYAKQYGRGEFKGVNGEQVSAVLNTIARIGVIDAKHFGGNSWHTPYGPICLHEQYIAQMGLGINDERYLEGYEQCLNFYRDNAIQPNGRVWPRWAYTNEDAMPGKYTDKGFYEAQWGYLLDSNPDYVSNVSELYEQTGDVTWVRNQQVACEKALDYLLKRDFNGNHLVEMINDNHTQQKSSDWIDIIWASYENAFVNAKLYHALQSWWPIEQQLGNEKMAKYYKDFAAKLKASFNKDINDGGFWDKAKGYYIYWRDKDNSTHGDNLVTPVNFMAIAYGICDDTTRRNSILTQVEAQMQKENLFFWPISMFPYKQDEGKEYQFPFPYYENGDIFLSWGSVAVKAYAAYKPALALKYIKNILRQDSIDGLAFQRYSRKKQDGQGDDILSGNSLAIVGLYQSVYGINPMHNRFYLDPHITTDIEGTKLLYNYRGQKLVISLDHQSYAVSNGQFTINARTDFGFFGLPDTLAYFNKDESTFAVKAITKNRNTLSLNIIECNSNTIDWQQTSSDEQGLLTYVISQLTPSASYSIYANGKLWKKIKSDEHGSLTFERQGKKEELKVVRMK